MAISVSDLRELPLPRLAPRTMLGIGLAAVAALLVLIVTRPPATVPILVAGADLPAGTPLSQLDVGVREVESAEGMVVGDELGELADWVLAAPIAEGEPLLASQLRPAVALDAPNVIAIELDAANAVLGRLSGGDRVDVYSTTTAPGSPSETRLIATGIYVLEARLAESNAGPDRVELLVAVDEDTAAAITHAIHDGEVDLVRVGP
jgi:Flp pilus assembly protein CpaB